MEKYKAAEPITLEELQKDIQWASEQPLVLEYRVAASEEQAKEFANIGLTMSIREEIESASQKCFERFGHTVSDWVKQEARICAISGRDFQPTKILPSVEEGIALIYTSENCYASVEFLNDKTIMAVMKRKDGTGKTIIWEFYFMYEIELMKVVEFFDSNK